MADVARLADRFILLVQDTSGIHRSSFWIGVSAPTFDRKLGAKGLVGLRPWVIPNRATAALRCGNIGLITVSSAAAAHQYEGIRKSAYSHAVGISKVSPRYPEGVSEVSRQGISSLPVSGHPACVIILRLLLTGGL